MYGTDRLVKTDSEGFYEMDSLPAYDYDLRVVVGDSIVDEYAEVWPGKETLANVAIFVPLVAYLSAFFPKKNFFFPVLIGFLLSLFFEIVQFAFGIGAADVTDLLMNTAGTLVGLLLYRLLERIVKRRAVTVMNAVGIAAETLFISLLTISLLFG